MSRCDSCSGARETARWAGACIGLGPCGGNVPAAETVPTMFMTRLGVGKSEKGDQKNGREGQWFLHVTPPPVDKSKRSSRTKGHVPLPEQRLARVCPKLVEKRRKDGVSPAKAGLIRPVTEENTVSDVCPQAYYIVFLD